MIWGALLWIGSPAFAGKSDFDPSSVSKVAIFAFGGEVNIEQTETKSGIGVVDAANGLKQAGDTLEGLEEGTLQEAAQADALNAFTMVEEGLERTFAWEVPSRDELVAVEAYAAAHDEVTPDGKMAQMAENWASGMAPRGVLHPTESRRFKMPQRDALMEALGVDAVVVATVAVSGKDQGVSIGGVGTSRVKPKAYVRVQVFVPGEKKAVWTGGATGKKVDEAIRSDFGQASDSSAAIMAAIDLGMQAFTAKFGPDAS